MLRSKNRSVKSILCMKSFEDAYHLRCMTLAQLEAFLEVAMQRNFGKAARALSISQPALSARIKTLEAAVGEELFTRPKGGVRLTEPGARFLPFAERSVDLLREGSRIARQAATTSGQLHIGSTSWTSAYIAPRIFREFHEREPSVSLTLTTGRMT